jgi:hypothetical protein
MESAEIAGQDLSAIASARMRTNFWAILGFCVAGLICSLFVPASYLHMEQTSALIAEAPLS